MLGGVHAFFIRVGYHQPRRSEIPRPGEVALSGETERRGISTALLYSPGRWNVTRFLTASSTSSGGIRTNVLLRTAPDAFTARAKDREIAYIPYGDAPLVLGVLAAEVPASEPADSVPLKS